MSEELHIVPIVLVRQGESLIDRIELNEACQNRCIGLDSRTYGLNLRDDLTHVLGDLENAHVETCVLLFMLIQEGFKVLVNRMQESVDLLKTGLSESFNLTDPIIYHRCQFMSFISVFLRGKIELVEDDLADLDDLLVR